MNLKALLTLNDQQQLFANPRRIKLLQQIRDTGSISQGAREAGISYKAAWDAVNDMNLQADMPLVSSEKGGKGGGGAQLTPFGHRLLKVYDLMDQMQDMALEALLDEAVPMDNLLELMAHFSLKTSARNQLSGEIVGLQGDTLSDNVLVQLSSGQQVHAAITHASTDRLGLHPGKKVLLLVKAPTVLIHKQAVKNGNCLQGQLLNIKRNQDKSEITLDIGNGEKVYASVANELLQDIELQLGDYFYAGFSPENTIIATMN
ncbi:TOBE domain-containing protein [Shewanella yunxiaonensis]|uniref:TOBE domain-containing protein n=1 Tax=Shewanella yunxiaonensis TaxID=2829809 RepID=A0ABX7YTJ8_9GAMM|nr:MULTISPECIES: TOBE domain-containing protein [Shewanella]MDF0534646.1 TOBE domain-containing protein [Shewanella sp. A32]QUN05980.1 TOBE domain-containing protein [Shewanella yunxiaonensis]